MTPLALRQRLREAVDGLEIPSLQEGNVTAAVLAEIATHLADDGFLGADDKVRTERIARKLDIAHVLYVAYTDDWRGALVKEEVPSPVLHLAILLFVILAEVEPEGDGDVTGRALKHCNTAYNGLALAAGKLDRMVVEELEALVHALCRRWVAP